MLLVFVYEMSDLKFRDYLGFCIAIVNARFYSSVKLKAQKILRRAGWNPQVEFKGSYLFSASSGCTDVEIERRIEAAHKLLDLNVAGSNSRMQFHYGRVSSNDHGRDYIAHLPVLLLKCLSRAPKGAGKNLLTLVCDERSDVSSMRLHEAVAPAIARRGWVLLEQVFQARSHSDTVGLMFADIVGYLAARIDTISTDSELFEGLTPEQFERNGKIRKLRSSTQLIQKIKQINLYSHTSWAG